MKDLLFLAADVWLMCSTWYFGIRMFRTYGNHLLTLEWFVVALSSTNFLVWSLLGGSKHSPMYHLAYAFDAFSRSFGITLILVLGLMTVTHGYKPSPKVEWSAFGLALAGALIFGRMHNDHLVHDFPHVALATFYVVTNVLTSVFLYYFASRLWRIGARSVAVWTGLVTAAATFVAVTYDFFPFSFDDKDRTVFYIMALTVWGAQSLIYFYGYRALAEHNAATDAPAAHKLARA